MHVAELYFRSRVAGSADAQANAIHTLLAAWFKRGQIARGNTPIARVREGFRVVVRIPEKDSLKNKYANDWVTRALIEVRQSHLHTPKIAVLGLEPQTRPACTCRRRPFLILFTTFLHDEPAVRCGSCCGPVSLYRLPPTNANGTYEDFLSWVDAYQTLDDLFIGSGVGERFAHDQMARHDSALSRDGREQAALLERNTRVPVFYYLSKYFGRSDASERGRRCPSCKGPWLLTSPLHGAFDFRCHRCRLLSSVASKVRIATPTARP